MGRIRFYFPFYCRGINHRLEQVRRMRWEAGPVLPSFLDKDVLSSREREYFARYNDIITDYIEEVGIDVASYSEVCALDLG